MKRELTKHQLNVREALKISSETYGVSIGSIKGKSRIRPVAYARNLAIYLIRNILHCTNERTAKYVGANSPVSTYYSGKLIKGLMEQFPVERHRIEEAAKKLIDFVGLSLPSSENGVTCQ